MSKPTYLFRHFNVFPALGYWEIDSKPVSSREARYGAHPRAKWMRTEEADARAAEHAEDKGADDEAASGA